MRFFLAFCLCTTLFSCSEANPISIQQLLDVNEGVLDAEESRRVTVTLKSYLAADEFNLAEAEPLAGGWMSKMFRIDTPYQTFVLRIMDLGASMDSRYHEVAVSALAAHKGISPKLLHSDRDAAIMLIDYIPGRTVRYNNDEDLRAMLDLVIKWHQTSLPKHVLDNPQNLVSRMADRCDKCIARKIPLPSPLTASLSLMKTIDQTVHELFSDAVLCHNDLHCRNMLLNSQEAKLIDWTLAAYEDPFYDLASIATWLLLDKEEEQWMLQHYLGRNPSLREEQLWTLIRPMPVLILAIWAFYSIEEVPDSLCPTGIWDAAHPALVDEVIWQHATGQDPEMSVEKRYQIGCSALKHFQQSVNTPSFQQAMRTLVNHK